VNKITQKSSNNCNKENPDIGAAYSDLFPGYTLDQELMLTNAIKMQANMIDIFHKSLIEKDFDKNIADLMTVMYFNSTLGGYDKK
jgi:hypothetical protein